MCSRCASLALLPALSLSPPPPYPACAAMACAAGYSAALCELDVWCGQRLLSDQDRCNRDLEELSAKALRRRPPASQRLHLVWLGWGAQVDAIDKSIKCKEEEKEACIAAKSAALQIPAMEVAGGDA